MPPDRSTPTSRDAYGASSGPHSPVPQPASSTSSRCSARQSRVGERGRDELRARGTTGFPAWLQSWLAKASNVLSTNAFDARSGYVVTGCGGQHVHGDRITRLLLEPFGEDLHGAVHLTQHTVRQRKQSSPFTMFRLQGDDPGEALGGLYRSVQSVEQDAQVRVRVDVTGIQADRRSIGGFGLLRPACRAQHCAEIVVRIRMTRVECDGSLVGVDGLVQPAVRLEHNPEIAMRVSVIR